MNKFKSVVLLSLVGSQVVFSAGNAEDLHTIITQERIDHLREHSEILIVLNPVQHQAFADEINGLEQQLADNNIDGLQNGINELGARIEEALVANVYAPHDILHLRGKNAQLIDLNPVQHQAFAVAINGLEQQLADNNFGGLQNRIDELRAQIEEALG